jgi:hypothetical protein
MELIVDRPLCQQVRISPSPRACRRGFLQELLYSRSMRIDGDMEAVKGIGIFMRGGLMEGV